MRVLLLACFATFVGAKMLNDRESRIKRSSSKDSFEQRLEEGNNLLKDERNANDTMEFLRELHAMEEENRGELTASTKPDPEVLKAMEDYAKIEQNHMGDGDSIPEINRKNHVDAALYQGDMLLTKEQAEEMMEDIKENEAHHNKQ